MRAQLSRLWHALWHALRFRDALMITFLPLLALGFLLGASVRDYLRATQFDDWYSRAQSVSLAFSSRLHALKSLPSGLRLRDSFSSEDADASIIRLEVPAARWDSLELEADGQWAPWLDGKLHYGKSTIPIRFRKRGDNSVHWLSDKRTLTIRTPRDDFYKRYRSFALSAKDVLTSYLANRLSQEYGLLQPATEISPLYVNNRFFGVFRFIEVVDESFLRPLDRMPGNIFRGDAAERGEYYKGTTRNLFANPRIWDRASANDRWTSAGSGQLRLLMEEIAGGTFDEHLRMMHRLDRDEYARLFAYLLLVGDPYHIDDVHNELLYEDPSTQKLHPIPWDTRLRSLASPEKDLNDLFRAILRDPFVIDSTMREVSRRLENDSMLKVADSLVTSASTRYAQYLQYDRTRAGLVPDVGNAADAIATLRANAALLRTWLADDTIAFAANQGSGMSVLDFEARGRTGASLTALRFDGPIPASVALRLDANLNGALDASDPSVDVSTEISASGSRAVLGHPVVLFAAWNTSTPAILAGHMPYRMFVTGLPAGTRVEPVLLNRATGKAAAQVSFKAGDIIREGTGWHPWKYPVPQYRTHRLRGVVQLTETLRIPRGDTLIIEPGTTVRLGADISIVSEGRVIARGTSQQPIRIGPGTAGVPWGTFALQDRGADSSIFEHLEFAQGGGALIDRVEYTGMVNVHRAVGVVFRNVTFRENLRSDDALHALHANVSVLQSHFVRSNSDAIDYDISTGDIFDNVIEGSGNDGLDLMSSQPVIAGNRIIRSGDKGISVGEASRPFVFNNFIDSCTIGIETKDRSDPIVLNNVVTNNRTGLRERRKNWRYGGGGWPTLAETEFGGNKTPWIRDVFSRVTIQGVTGLDTANADAAANREDISWLYRLTGATPPGTPKPGLYATSLQFKPVKPVDQQFFEDNFGEVSDGWTGAGGVNRLEKRRDALVIETDRRAGTASRSVSWHLPKGGTLIVELSARDFSTATVAVTGSGKPVSRNVSPQNDMATASFFALELPPGDYTSVGITLQPVPGLTRTDSTTGLLVPRSARLDLRSFRVMSRAD